MRLPSLTVLAAGRRGLALLALVASLGLAGCPIESDHPLEPAAADDLRLRGMWIASGEDGPAYFHIFRPKDAPTGSIEVVLVAYEGDGVGESSRYAGHLSEVDGQLYANLQGPILGETPEGPYMLVNYRFSNGALELRLLSEAAVHTAIAAGSLSGEPNMDGSPGDRISDSPAKIRAFLAAADPAGLFEDPIRLVAIKPQP